MGMRFGIGFGDMAGQTEHPVLGKVSGYLARFAVRDAVARGQKHLVFRIGGENFKKPDQSLAVAGGRGGTGPSSRSPWP